MNDHGTTYRIFSGLLLRSTENTTENGTPLARFVLPLLVGSIDDTRHGFRFYRTMLISVSVCDSCTWHARVFRLFFLSWIAVSEFNLFIDPSRDRSRVFLSFFRFGQIRCFKKSFLCVLCYSIGWHCREKNKRVGASIGWYFPFLVHHTADIRRPAATFPPSTPCSHPLYSEPEIA